MIVLREAAMPSDFSALNRRSGQWREYPGVGETRSSGAFLSWLAAVTEV
jgi:hypothetical protein